ncbi:TcpQ domain-containing protein [Bordetella petrii]|uniref:TcpQ domain-containing protein n=1 Tax=Bordetella petrii TaxID=94624 RepID=UPI00049201BA|nr:TcpQ domain-containing protein [Bordetella petrii]
MVRFFLLALAPLWLSGCAQWSGAAAGWQGDGLPAGQYDFNWRLSGDPAVAPLQVFSGAGRTWLQFAPGRTPPALFAQTPAGLQPLRYKRHDPYVVVDGLWPALVLRGGHRIARADRHDGDPAGALGAEAAAPAVAPEPAAAQLLSAAPASVPQAGPAVGPAASGGPSRYRAGPPDASLRAVLARWATDAGWTFEPQHWAVDADIPLAGSADFTGDFKQAVRELLGATEMSDRPVQPCFYLNKVLRVVPLAQACDRSVAAGART